MSLLKDAGVPPPKFGVATTVEEAKKIAEDLGTKDLVVKAQVCSTTATHASEECISTYF